VPRLFDHRIELGVSDDSQSLLKQTGGSRSPASRLFAVRDAACDSAVKAKVISGQVNGSMGQWSQWEKERQRWGRIGKTSPSALVYHARR
jgi:hypothetical protein